MGHANFHLDRRNTSNVEIAIIAIQEVYRIPERIASLIVISFASVVLICLPATWGARRIEVSGNGEIRTRTRLATEACQRQKRRRSFAGAKSKTRRPGRGER